MGQLFAALSENSAAFRSKEERILARIFFIDHFSSYDVFRWNYSLSQFLELL